MDLGGGGKPPALAETVWTLGVVVNPPGVGGGFLDLGGGGEPPARWQGVVVNPRNVGGDYLGLGGGGEPPGC